MNMLPGVCLFVFVMGSFGAHFPYGHYPQYKSPVEHPPYGNYPVPKKPSPKAVCHWPGHCLGKFMCGNSHPLFEKCVDLNKVCNGFHDCDDGSDEMTCQKGPECYNTMLCRDRKTCARPCDTIIECPDKDDEAGCPHTCPFNEYKCEGRKDQCIPLNQVCDGERDCLLGDDEKQCTHTCPFNEYKCEGRKDQCIPLNRVCDGERDCLLGDDEKQCNFACEEGQYRCVGEDKCLANRQVCDGRRDCQNGDDEDACVDPCPLGWFRFRDSCYFFAGEDRLDYADAREFCEDRNSYLATINDQEENEYLQAIADQRGPRNFWIGLNDINNEGTFRWISTGDVVDFEDWVPNEPTSQVDNDDCVHLRRDYNYRWRVDRCDNEHRFICKQPVAVQ